MSRRTSVMLPLVLLVAAVSLPASALPNHSRAIHAAFLFSATDTDRDRDGLSGPVRRVRTETAKLTNKGGKPAEGPRAVLESLAYDIKGTKIENAYFPVPGAALTGKEVYKYDDKGNIVEMTLLNADGSLLSKEVYSYEFDQFGNWTKMTTSVAVIEGGKLSYEPTEVTYRTISYYLDEATLARMSQPATQPAATNATTTATAPAPTAQQTSPAAVSPAAKSTTGTVQTTAAAKTSAPLPSGASLVKANMAAAPDGAAALRQVAGTATTAAVKVDGEPPPVARAPKPLLKPISGGVLNGKALDLPRPAYPPQAKTARAEGVVTVEVVIDEKGKVISARATSGHNMLRQAAVQAAQGARFSPTMLSGQPVKVTGEINYNFALSQ
jgi:TonB family protein